MPQLDPVDVLIIGSGHMTHNLREAYCAMRQSQHGAPYPYVREFQDWVGKRILANDADTLADYRQLAPNAARAHPTEEHFLPLFVALGAAGLNPKPELIYQDIELQSLAMDAWVFH